MTFLRITQVLAAGADSVSASSPAAGSIVSGFGQLMSEIASPMPTASPVISPATSGVNLTNAQSATVSGDFFVIHIATPSNVIKNLGDLVSAGITSIIVIAGLLTFVYLVWGGIEWLTSGGDKEKYEAARGRITAALIGLAIISASWAIMQLVSHFFGISITTLDIPSAVKP